MSTLLPVHQMPAAGESGDVAGRGASDPLGADQVRGIRGRTSHRLRDDHIATSGDVTGLQEPIRATQDWGDTARDSRVRVTISPDQPIGAGPYPPRRDPWTPGSGNWPVRAEGWTTGSIPVVPPEQPRWLRPTWVTGVTLAWVLTVALAALVGRVDGVRPVALFAHLIFLVIGFGAVLAIGLNGAALLMRWVRVSRVVTLTVVLDPLVWLGLAGLCLTGILLGPELGSGWTWVKLLAALVVAINGLANRDLMTELGRLPVKAGRRSISPALLRRTVRVSAITQLGWWLAVLIGYLSVNTGA